MISSYSPLFIKYRPRTFNDLIGQDVLVQILTNAIRKDRIGGALIFTGTRGVGKTSVARILARALNCPNRTTDSAEPCGKCKTCLDILAERHMDVIEIDAASHTGVDDVREIIESCKYKPIDCKYKIYIIDEVHMLSKSAFNALLKTLEEPPAHVKFFLATTEINRVPETVLSRCLKFHLNPVPKKLLSQHLANVLNQEKIKADVEAINIIAQAADGSVRDALSILEQAINFNAINKVTLESVKILLGYGNHTLVQNVMTNCLVGDIKQCVCNLRNYYNSGGSVAELLNRMLELLHWLTCVKNGNEPLNSSFLDDEFIELLKVDIISNTSIASLSRMWQACLKAMDEVQRIEQMEQACEMVFVRLCYLSKLPELSDLVNKPNIIKREINSQHSPNSVAKESLSIETVKPKLNNLNDLLSYLQDKREMLLLNELKSTVVVLDFDDHKIVFSKKSGFKNDFIKRLTMALPKDRKWQIEVKENSEGAPLSVREQDQVNESKRIAAIKDSEFMQAAQELFPSATVEITKNS